jgi:hypothetical protein
MSDGSAEMDSIHSAAEKYTPDILHYIPAIPECRLPNGDKKYSVQ